MRHDRRRALGDATGQGTTGGHDDRLAVSDVAKLIRRGRRRLVGAARADERETFQSLIADHLGTDPSAIDITQESWPTYDHVNVQTAIDAWLVETGHTHRLLGVAAGRHNQVSLSDLLTETRHMPEFLQQPGSVSRVNLPCGPDGAVRPCVTLGLYLLGDGGQHAIALLRRGVQEMGESRTTLEVLAADPEYGPRLLAELRELALRHNVYRGQVVTFGGDVFGQRETVLSFERREPLTADDLVLPQQSIDAITAQVVGVARHRERLLGAGQHLKRGLLLYGPPGVGKTHTVRYLVSQLTDTTIVLLTGTSVHLVGQACSVARTLQPSMVVIEDVDLIAEERGHYPGQSTPLFQLLNEMDGLREDADVVCLLTTNRADLLEPALAQRPGRVDQAVAIELPDREARARLIALYRGGLDLDLTDIDDVLDRTDGVTASFLKELLRRAAVIAARLEDAAEGAEPSALRVTAEHLSVALDELLDTQNAMTRVLLGGAPSSIGAPFSPPGRAVPGLAPR